MLIEMLQTRSRKAHFALRNLQMLNIELLDIRIAFEHFFFTTKWDIISSKKNYLQFLQIIVFHEPHTFIYFIFLEGCFLLYANLFLLYLCALFCLFFFNNLHVKLFLKLVR